MIKEIEQNAKDKMEKAIVALKSQLATLRAGRANPAMLDRISVDYYGTKTPLNQMAGISAPEPRLLTVQPWDISALSMIEKAILASDLGLNPSNDGKVIRLNIPQLTEERRAELCKAAHKEGEEAKIAIRNVRRHAIAKMKDEEKNKLITEDDVKEGEKNIQKDTDDYVKKVDETIKAKEAEIKTV